MKHDEMMDVIQAHKEGKQIQSRRCDDASRWTDDAVRGLGCDFNFDSFDYRIKTEPREWFVKLWPNGRIEINKTIGVLTAYSDKGNTRVREVLDDD